MRVISWEKYIQEKKERLPLALTVGVFDGVHLGHQALIQRICAPPILGPEPPLPAVVTFRQNPMSVLRPDDFAGDILSLEQKLAVLETLGVKLVVLIDFSGNFSKTGGRDFIDLLLGGWPVKLIALGRNFRCGYRLDTGIEEIQEIARARRAEVWVAAPVMDEGQPVSSSRIRRALAAGRIEEAERLLGRLVNR